MSHFARKDTWASQISRYAFLVGCTPPILLGSSLLLLNFGGFARKNSSLIATHLPTVSSLLSDSDRFALNDELSITSCSLLVTYSSVVASTAYSQFKNLLVNFRFLFPTTFLLFSWLSFHLYMDDGTSAVIYQPIIFSTACFGVAAAAAQLERPF